MAKPDNEKILQTALERFQIIENRERQQRKLAIEDMKFVNVEDGQWTEDAIERRANRPRYSINRIAGAVDQLVGDQRQNRTQIKVRPISGGADEKTAKIFNGLIRNIESQSNAENSYDSAYDEEVTGGYGGWRVLTEFNDDDSFEQDIRILPIMSAATSLWFAAGAEAYDKRDAQHAFLTKDIPTEEFKTSFPNAVVSDFTQEMFSSSLCNSWFRDDVIRIAEYWVKTPVMRTVALLSDGRVISVEDEKKVIDELAAQGIKIVKQRKVKSHKVEMYKLNGLEILEGPNAWAGKYIPLIPAYGKISNIEGRTYIRGLTRFAKDPQRIYNYSTSAAIEAAALTPKDPYWLTPAQALGHENQLKTFNKKNQPFMFYNVDPKSPGPPARTGAPSVQTALLSQVQQAALDIESTTGLHAPSLGSGPQLLSERSMISQAEKGDRGAFVFQDNLAKSIQFTGDILIDLIPRIYDTPRMVRILGLDGKSEVVGINQEALSEINQPIVDEQTGETVIVNDLSKGKYDVITETGPAFNTLRSEAAQQLIELSAASPVFADLTPDLIAKNLDIVDGEEFVQRLRKFAIQQGIATPTEEEIEEMGLNQPQAPDPAQTALTDNVNMQTEKLKADIENQDAKTQQVLIDTQSQTIDAYEKLIKSFKEQKEVGIPFSRQDHRTRVNQVDIMQDAQGVIRDDQPNSEEAEDLARIIQEQPIQQ